MKRELITISERMCFLYHDAAATHLLIQPVDEHDLEVLDQEVDFIRNQTKTSFSLIALLIENWNLELTPWVAPAVFGKIPFGDRAEDTFIYMLVFPPCQSSNKCLALVIWLNENVGFHTSSAIAKGTRRHQACPAWRIFSCWAILPVGILSDGHLPGHSRSFSFRMVSKVDRLCYGKEATCEIHLSQPWRQGRER